MQTLSCVVPQNSGGHVPSSSAAAPGRFLVFSCPCALGCLGGEGGLKADAGSFISLANSWPVVRTDTQRSLPSRTHHCPWFPAADPVDPVPGPELPPPDSEHAAEAGGAGGPGGRGLREGLRAGYCSGLALPQLAEHVPPAPPGFPTTWAEPDCALIPRRLHLGGDC